MRSRAEVLRPASTVLAAGALLVAAAHAADAQPKPPLTAPTSRAAAPVSTSSSHATAGPAADTAPARDAIKETARDLFDRAVKAMDEQRWEDCRAAFVAAFNIHRSYQIAGNLALCEMKAGRITDAAEHVAFALREMPADAPADRRQGAEGIQKEVRPKVAEITVRVSKPDAEVVVDGHPVGRSPLTTAIFVEPGKRRVEARLLGKVVTGALEATAGGTHTIDLKLPDVVPPHSVARSPVPAFVLGGAALAALGVGIGLTITAHDGDAHTQDLFGAISGSGGTCVSGAPNYDARCDDFIAGARTNDGMSRAGVGLFAGAGALLAGALLYSFWPGAAPVKLHASVTPGPFGSAGSIQLRGDF